MEYEEEYKLYLKERSNVGSKDVVASSISSYVSYLRAVEEHLDIQINPSSLSSTSHEHGFVRELTKQNVVSNKTIANYRSAMRQYMNMVGEFGLEIDENYYLPLYELNEQLKSTLFSTLQELQMTEVLLIDCIYVGYDLINKRTVDVLSVSYKKDEIEKKGLNALGTTYCSIYGFKLSSDLKNVAKIRNKIAHRYAYEHFSQTLTNSDAISKKAIVDKTVQLMNHKLKAHKINTELLSCLNRVRSELNS